MPICRSRVLAGRRGALQGNHPPLAAASFQMLLATAVAKDGELHHFDAEQVFLKAYSDEEIYMRLPNIRSFREQWGC